MRLRRNNMRKPPFAALLALAVALGCAAPDTDTDTDADTDGAPAEAAPAAAQVAGTPPQPGADPADVESIDAIVTSVYEVISGDAGVERDWDRFRSLFLPQARLMQVSSRHGEDGRSSSATVMSPDEFIEGSNEFFVTDGFYEVEIGSVTEQYGDIAHRFSSYASFRTDDPDEDPFNRGINSFQLLYDGERWWVVGIFWQHEPDAGPIPPEYLDDP